MGHKSKRYCYYWFGIYAYYIPSSPECDNFAEETWVKLSQLSHEFNPNAKWSYKSSVQEMHSYSDLTIQRGDQPPIIVVVADYWRAGFHGYSRLGCNGETFHGPFIHTTAQLYRRKELPSITCLIRHLRRAHNMKILMKRRWMWFVLEWKENRKVKVILFSNFNI